ncbi:hypothetical protein C8J56DRAFT_800902, partial [Mycena floridula]
EWDALLNEYLSLEAAYGFVNNWEGFPAAKQPAELTTWIGAGCLWVSHLEVKGVKTFSKKVLSWWKSLQPSWRQYSFDGLPLCLDYGDDWSSLGIPGRNGMTGIIALFFWWGCTINTKIDDKVAEAQLWRREWISAIRDVCWVIAGLLANEKKPLNAK